jgi:hypothetical protein
VQVGKLGYDYKFSMWSIAEKGGLRMLSVNAANAENRTFDTPPGIPPESYVVYPPNGSTDINPINTNLTLHVSDKDGNLITIYWQTNTSGPWTTFATTSGVGNGTYQTLKNFSYLHKYYWRAVLTDDADVEDSVYVYDTNDNISGIFDFTTKGSTPAVLSDESPSNGSTGVSRYRTTVNITIEDPDGDHYNWTIHGAYVTTASGTNAVNGTKTANLITPLPTNSWIYWYVNVTDGSTWTNRTYNFRTTSNSAPNPPTDPVPVNNTSYNTVYNVYMRITVSDPESDYMDVSFYWQNGSLIGRDMHVASGGQASIFMPDNMTPDWLNHDTVFRWYARATDGSETTQSGLYNFHTSIAWDLDENRNIDLTDVSLLVSHYGEELTPGSLPWDIDNNGHTDITDVSILVSHYGESY